MRSPTIARSGDPAMGVTRQSGTFAALRNDKQVKEDSFAALRK